MEVYGDAVEQYQEFARHAAGDSPCFEEWALGVAADAEVLAWLGTLPPGKDQPNLVFAAARLHGVPAPGPYSALRTALLEDDGALRATILSRATQTNEVRRLATLLPAFASLGLTGPVALVEAGASAGLCLYPDRWSYAWHTASGVVGAGTGSVLSCEVSGPAPVPAEPPAVAWRAGLDLQPVDVHDEAAVAWLRTLVWPEHEDRRVVLDQAVALARAEPPDLRRGDLLVDLPALVEEAAGHGPVVVFHSAVVAYLRAEDRERFHDLMTGLVRQGACHWVSNEAPAVLPRVAATGPDRPGGPPAFVLGVDGRAVAWTHGHGRWLRWTG